MLSTSSIATRAPNHQGTSCSRTLQVSCISAQPVMQDSLGALNARLDAPLPMTRFRPNIVVRGDAPFAEDKWVNLHAGDLELNLRKPCGRCKARKPGP